MKNGENGIGWHRNEINNGLKKKSWQHRHGEKRNEKRSAK
jgi:hypothetical protein